MLVDEECFIKSINMKITLLFLTLIVVSSCFPVSIAPDLENGKVIRAKKFKRKLSAPNRYTYVFTDTKAADEFYHYVNTKYQLDHQYVEDNVPVVIDGNTYYVSFYEAEKTTKTVNLIPIIIDGKRERNGNEPLFEDDYTSRWGTWYILLMITAEDFQDGLNPEYVHYDKVKNFAEALKDEYYRTSNYNQAILTPSKK